MSPLPELLTIEANKSERHYWRDLWRYRELAGFLAWRDIKVRYKQAALGVSWAVIQPAINTILLTFVFGKLAKMPDGGVPYALIVLCGLLPWQLFNSAFSGSSASLVGNSHLISKIYFPRLIVPISSLAVALVDFGILLLLALPIVAVFGIYPGWQLLLLPFFLMLTLVIALGAGLWITALTVRFRDFKFITPFIIQIGVFVTPVGYRMDFLPNWQQLLSLNPLAACVDGVRWCLLGGQSQIYLPGLITSLLTASVLLITGIWYFRRTERNFADII